MKKRILFFALFLMGCGSTTSTEPFDDNNVEPNTDLPIEYISVGDQTFIVEVARSAKERMQGLMFRESLPEGHGMLFIFPREDFLSFWMKNTFISLDIAWINKDNTIVDRQTMHPCTDTTCRSHIPNTKARMVLEVNAGELTARIGDTFSFLSK